MTQRYWPWDSVGGDRVHGSAEVAAALARMVTNGVVRDYASELEVVESAPPAMSVDVGLGAGWVRGRFLEVHTTVETLPIATADATNPRIDRVVLRAHYDNRLTEVAVKTGTPAGSPSAPALQQDDDIYEIALAQVAVGALVTQINTVDITDERSYSEPQPHAVVHAAAGDDPVTITHAQTTGKTANDHHNENHAARHLSGGGDTVASATVDAPGLMPAADRAALVTEDIVPTSGNIDLDFTDGGTKIIGPTSGAIDIDLIAPAVSGYCSAKIIYGGAHAVVINTAVQWRGGSPPSFTSANLTHDLLTLFWDAVNAVWSGDASLGHEA